MACGNVVGHYATPEYFDKLCDRGLIMWGGLTAGDWQYIGFQGVLQGVYELFGAVAREHFAGSLARRFVLTAGLGGIGSAQPLAISLADACGSWSRSTLKMPPGPRARPPWPCDRRHRRGPLLPRWQEPRPRRRLIGRCGDRVPPTIAKAGVVPDVVTDLTAAHDAVFGYCPVDYTLEQRRAVRESDPSGVAEKAQASMALQLESMIKLKAAGAVVFEDGNNLRVQARGWRGRRRLFHRVASRSAIFALFFVRGSPVSLACPERGAVRPRRARPPRSRDVFSAGGRLVDHYSPAPTWRCRVCRHEAVGSATGNGPGSPSQ